MKKLTQKRSADVMLRPRRQITVPKDICEQLGIAPGDMLELTLEDSALIARPRRAAAMKALRAIREAFQRSGISEEEFQEELRKARAEIMRELYGIQG